MRTYLLAYDADCGPCARFKRSVEFLDSYRRFDFMALAQADDEGFLNAVPVELRHRSFHLISPAGEVLSGAKAVPALISLLPAGTMISKFIMSAPGGLRATAFVYAVLSRLHDTGACHYRPGQGYTRPNKLELFDRRFGLFR